MAEGKGFTVRKVYSPVVNYAMQQNHMPIIRQLVLCSETDGDIRELTVEITAQPDFALPCRLVLDVLPAGGQVALDSVDILPNAAFLMTVTERISGFLMLRVLHGGEAVYEEALPIEVMAFNEWSQNAQVPELIAAFVTPNHPSITAVCKQASDILGQWSGDPSMNAYQTNNPSRVRQQIAAVYAALQSRGIAYCVPPASFEHGGQRVRLCDAVLEQKLGTCLDLTLLFAACLEAVGIHPLLILMRDHTFLGAWLTDESFPESVQDDLSLLTKRMAEGLRSITALETTALTAGKGIGYEEAERLALEQLSDSGGFSYFVDVRRARTGGIRPLALRIPDGREDTAAQQGEAPDPYAVQLPDELACMNTQPDQTPRSVSKKEMWERKLLDLSLRNNLLNFRQTKNTLRILATKLDAIEDALASGGDFQVLERPSDWEEEIHEAKLFEQHSMSALSPLLENEFEQKRLRSDLTAQELSNTLKLLYRKSRDAIEENGANVLYLAVGFLRWFESDASQMPRYAPIVLLPIEIVRKSAKFGYILRQRDDEPQVNITLLELLKRDYGVSEAGLDPLPLNEHGVNIRMIFSRLRQAVMSKSRWDICEDACLGIFSFNRFVMWNDIHSRGEELASNKIVKSLMSGKTEFEQAPLFPDRGNPDEFCETQEVFLTTNADASQLAAIYAANSGKSFVLHGPPGTGKSQTITNIISNALAQGKTVLFVAEKMAALSVVQKRLEQIGLGPFCLELHSNKATRKAVLEQLRNAVEVTREGSTQEFMIEANRIAMQREELNEYRGLLYKKQPFGLTLYDAISRYFQYEDAADGIAFDGDAAAGLTEERLKAWEDMAFELIVAGAEAGEPSRHPLEGIWAENYTPELREKAYGELGRLSQSAATAEKTAKELQELYQIEASFSTLREYGLLAELTLLLRREPFPPAPLLLAEDKKSALEMLRGLCRHGGEEKRRRLCLLEHFDGSILQFDADAALREWRELSEKWILPKALGEGRIVKAVNALRTAGPAVEKQQMPALLEEILRYQAERAAVEEMTTAAAGYLGGYWQGFETDWEQVLTCCALCGELDAVLTSLVSDRAAQENAYGALTRVLAAGTRRDSTFADSFEKVSGSCKAVCDLLHADFGQEYPQSGRFLERVCALSARWSEHMDDLRAWCGWMRTRNRALALGLSPLVGAYETGTISGGELIPAFRKGLYRACVSHILSQDETLSDFSGAMFEEKIRRFRETSETLESLSRAEIIARLSARIYDCTQEAAQSAELGILKRAIRSNGRGLSIRSLFGQLKDLLRRLCPCMLMSPISVAQYLDPGFRPFDLVVFDEASQMPTSEAVGAIARGENAVIVGDPKQLPPTSFFMADTADEMSFETEDLDSILDDCLALSLPDMHLRWHYRSRHESLITFSNIKYYGNQLLTFPSPNNLVSKVSFVPVEGFYDRGKTKQNFAEASAVVADILHRLQNGGSPASSIGVVTFSSVQQNLIDDLLSDAFREHPELEDIAKSCHEPIFVKNLENVQGDERDVILFSVGYGPDESGRVCHNFGPLNQAGGWRRLNVAVSRARQEMTVYSTLSPEQLDLSRTGAEGIAGLKAFLEFAKMGRSAIPYRQSELPGTGSNLNEHIAARLGALGFEAHTNVGSSNYKVDIAVVHPEKKTEYILGILCNGQSYRNAPTANDREILQKQVLAQLGWNLHTIWVLDWWERPERELLKIKKKIEDLLAGHDDSGAAPKTAEAAPLIASSALFMKNDTGGEPAENIARCRSYVVTPLRNVTIPADAFFLPENEKIIHDRIQSVVETEGPVSRELLCKRVLSSFGISRKGSRLERYLTELLRKLQFQTSVYNQKRFYWPVKAVPSAWSIFRVSDNDEARRAADELPVEEIACAVRFVLMNRIRMSKDELVHAAYRALGYARSGSMVEQAMLAGIEYALQKGFITMDQEAFALS